MLLVEPLTCHGIAPARLGFLLATSKAPADGKLVLISCRPLENPLALVYLYFEGPYKQLGAVLKAFSYFCMVFPPSKS